MIADQTAYDILGSLIPALAIILVAYIQLRRAQVRAKRASVFSDRMFREFVASLLPLMRSLQENIRARGAEAQNAYDRRLLESLDRFLDTTDEMLVGPKEGDHP